MSYAATPSPSRSPRSAICATTNRSPGPAPSPATSSPYTGWLGWSAAGHAVLSRGFRSPRAFVEAHRRPEPPYHAGPAAAGLGATAMTDVSDGLVADLGHIAEASKVRIDLRSGLPSTSPRR